MKRLVTTLTILFILLGTMAAGCLGVRAPPVSNPPAPTVVVDYHRSGGVAGVDDRLVIFDNGAAVVATKTTSRDIFLNASEISGIYSLFDEAQFSELQANYPAPRGSADLFHYSISYNNKTVMMDESAFPARVNPILNRMDNIIQQAGR